MRWVDPPHRFPVGLHAGMRQVARKGRVGMAISQRRDWEAFSKRGNQQARRPESQHVALKKESASSDDPDAKTAQNTARIGSLRLKNGTETVGFIFGASGVVERKSFGSKSLRQSGRELRTRGMRNRPPQLGHLAPGWTPVIHRKYTTNTPLIHHPPYRCPVDYRSAIEPFYGLKSVSGWCINLGSWCISRALWSGSTDYLCRSRSSPQDPSYMTSFSRSTSGSRGVDALVVPPPAGKEIPHMCAEFT